MTGVTLLELLMVLSLSTCLTAAGASIYSQLLARSQLIALTNQLSGLMKDTQHLSLRTNKTHYFDLHIDPANACWSISQHSDCHCNVEAVASCAQQLAQIPSKYNQIQISSNRESLVFTPLFGYSNAGSYKLSVADYATRIVISSLGRIRICSDAGDIYQYAEC